MAFSYFTTSSVSCSKNSDDYLRLFFTVFGYIFGHKLHLFYRHFAHKDQYQFLSKDNIDRRKRVTFILQYFHEKGSIPGKSRDCSLLEGDVVVIHFLFGDTCDNFLGFGRKRNVK